jgi:hypothetical protein
MASLFSVQTVSELSSATGSQHTQRRRGNAAGAHLNRPMDSRAAEGDGWVSNPSPVLSAGRLASTSVGFHTTIMQRQVFCSSCLYRSMTSSCVSNSSRSKTLVSFKHQTYEMNISSLICVSLLVPCLTRPERATPSQR